ncbi:hypothetical protein N0V85_008812, partial [Neurospora sp. IMI 360204]
MSAPTRIRIAGSVVGKQQPSQCRSYFLSNRPPTNSPAQRQPTSTQPTTKSPTKAASASLSPASVANTTTTNKRSTSTLPETRPRNLPETWFNHNNVQIPAKSESSTDEIRPPDGPGGLNKPPDERKVKLGK